MQINKNRKGLALGAVLSLFASLIVGAAPASANTDGQYIALTPAAGPVTNFNGVLYEDFPLTAYLLPGVDNTQFASDKAIFEVTKISGALDVIVSSSAAAQTINGSAADRASASSNVSFSGLVEASTTSAVTFAAIVDGSTKAAFFNMKAYTASPGLVSSSPNVTVQIKVWVENLATTNGQHDPLEWYTTQTVTLHSANSVPAVTTMSAAEPGDTVLTVSAVVSALNFSNLSGSFFLQVNATNNQLVGGAPSVTISAPVSGAVATARAGVVSQSFAISTSALAGTSFSAHVRFHSSAAAGGGFQLGATTSAVVAATKAAALLVQAVSTSNSVMPQASTASVRANTTVTYKVTATSNSASISGAVVTVGITETGGSTLALNSKEISVNGAASTTSYPTALSLTTGADGTATFTLATSGFVGTEALVVTATEQNVFDTLNVVVLGVVPTLTADYSQLSSGAGETSVVTFAVKDQWGVSYAGSDLRVAVTKGGTGFSYTDTLSYVAVVAGKASFNFTPTPAAKTGSATVTARLQQLQASTGTYLNESNGANVVVSVNVSAAANAFGTGLASSYAASVSYFPSTLAAAVAVSGKVVNTGSAVVISGPGLVFEDASGDTFSDTVTVRADGTLTYTVNVYGTKAGSTTLTLTNGSASTSSLFVVSAAAHDSGRSISFDTTTIDAGKTRIVTGKVLDMNGNPVNTTAGAGTASILVTFAGTAGIPVGAMPTETNADGEFQVSVLTSAADRGTFTLTATYLKAGVATAVKDQITAVQSITVGIASSAPASDQKLTVGSFKGFVAIYALNYTGQKLSAKVAGKWLVVNELSKFQRVVRNTGAGFTIKVDLYIDGAFVRSETVVTK